MAWPLLSKSNSLSLGGEQYGPLALCQAPPFRLAISPRAELEATPALQRPTAADRAKGEAAEAAFARWLDASILPHLMSNSPP